MIDGLFKRYLDPLWERPARPLARLMTANQVTLMGLALVALASLAYLWHRNPLWFALSLAAAFSADSLDGAVARIRAESSRFGSYLDAVIDRYQEMIALAAMAGVSGAWAAGYFAIAGAFLTSYMKARAAMEVTVDNGRWPDLFERQERIVFICLALLGQSLVTPAIIPGALWLLAALTHLTALQRFRRARRLLAP